MATMNISLPDEMKAFVEERVESGSYANSSDFVRDVLRREMERQRAIAELQRLYDEGIASGISKLTPDQVFARARERAYAAAATRKAGSRGGKRVASD